MLQQTSKPDVWHVSKNFIPPIGTRVECTDRTDVWHDEVDAQGNWKSGTKGEFAWRIQSTPCPFPEDFEYFEDDEFDLEAEQYMLGHL